MKNLYICSSKILTNIVETLRKQKKKKEQGNAYFKRAARIQI